MFATTRRGIPTGRIVAVAALFGGILLAVVLLKILTPHGTVIIEIGDSDEQVKVTVTKDDTIKIIDPNDGKEVLVTVDADAEKLTLRKEGFEIQTTSFNLKSKDGRYVKVTFVQVEAVAEGSNVDREVARMVLDAGGTVGVSVNGGEPIKIAKAGDLPLGTFSVVVVAYVTKPEEDLNFLEHLSLLRRLEALTLHRVLLSNEQLVHLQRLTCLKQLSLCRTNLTDDTIVHLQKLKNLEGLRIDQNRITD